MVRAIGYLRVSTAEQAAHGYGLKAQERAIRELCRRRRWQLEAILSDEGESGSHGLDTRVGLSDAIARCKRGEAERLVVGKLDRLARDLLLQLTIIDGLKKHQVEVVSVEEPDFEGPDDMRDLIRNVLGAVAQYERAAIRGRMMSGKAAKAAGGGYVGGQPGYGQKAQDGRLTADQDEARVVDLIRAQRAAGASYRAICAALDAAGYRPRRGERWQPAVVRRVALRGGVGREEVPLPGPAPGCQDGRRVSG